MVPIPLPTPKTSPNVLDTGYCLGGVLWRLQTLAHNHLMIQQFHVILSESPDNDAVVTTDGGGGAMSADAVKQITINL